MTVNVGTSLAYRVDGATNNHQYRRLFGPYGYEKENKTHKKLIAEANFEVLLI